MTWFDGGDPPDPTRGVPRSGPRGDAAPPDVEVRGPATSGWRAPAPPVLSEPVEPVAPFVPVEPVEPVAPFVPFVPDVAPEPVAGPVAGPVVRPVAADGRARLRAAAARASDSDELAERGAVPEGEAVPGPRWYRLGALDSLDAPGLLGEPGDPPRRRGLLAAVRWRVRPRTAGVFVLALALVGGAVALRAAGAPSEAAVAIPEPLASATATLEVAVTPGGREVVVWVHVVGQVAAPGLVSLPAGSRVAEAVAAAGGALPEADLAAVNLAAEVTDGSQVHVPAPGEVPAPAEQPAARGGDPSTVDVNAAGAGELETLPGIGPVLAERIVTWREEHGPFADVDALRDVPGIGPSVLGQIRSRVRV